MQYGEWLKDIRHHAEERLEKAQEALDAVVILEKFCEETIPEPEPAPVEEVRRRSFLLLSLMHEPMHRKEICERLEEARVHVGTEDPVARLGAILSRFHNEFESHGGGFWSVKRPPFNETAISFEDTVSSLASTHNGFLATAFSQDPDREGRLRQVELDTKNPRPRRGRGS